MKEGKINLTSDGTGSCSRYTTISDEQLCSVVREVLEILPDAGETYVIGVCRQRNIFDQAQRIRDAINTTDPVSRTLGKFFGIMQQLYSVPAITSL